MKNIFSDPPTQFEILRPFWMIGVLSLVGACYHADVGNLYVSYQGTHARVVALFCIFFLMQFYRLELQKTCYKTHRVFICIGIFIILKFLGCCFVPWWKVWMSIPLTILWYPFHYRILEGLPRKESDTRI